MGKYLYKVKFKWENEVTKKLCKVWSKWERKKSNYVYLDGINS
jgi:hypothetical protein